MPPLRRDPRLRALSSDHHQALVLARRLLALVAAGQADAAIARATAETFARELEPHFRREEERLLAHLGPDAAALVRRTLDDHAALRAAAEAAAQGAAGALAPFAERLIEHVRFEERELFPHCEAALPAALLDALRDP